MHRTIGSQIGAVEYPSNLNRSGGSYGASDCVHWISFAALKTDLKINRQLFAVIHSLIWISTKSKLIHF